jgi:hypothetical protein
MKLASRKLGIGVAAVCLGLVGTAGLAQAEIERVGTLQVSFSGSIAPVKLPRAELAPVTVQMGGKITTTDKSTPPKLEKIILDINSHGVLNNKGLATCSLGKLNSITSAQAKKSCEDALVGHGNVTSRVSLPGQGAFASNGTLLAFNGKIKGKPAVLAQVSSGAPLPLTYVIGFEVKKTSGTFGSSLIGTLPPIASEYGYISAFSLSLGRKYESNGKKMSFASANCPAPGNFPGASFPFARATYEFAGGLKVDSQLVRECKVRN